MKTKVACLRVCVTILGLWTIAAGAQLRPYGVVDAGVERRKVLANADRLSPDDEIGESRNHKDGAAFGVGIGVEALIYEALFVSGEASLSRAAVRTRAEQFRGIQLSPGLLVGINERTEIEPRWSYAFTGRAGASVTPGLALYGLAGYGGERVRRQFTSNTINPEASETQRTDQTLDSFIYGAGLRLLMTDHLGIRVEYQRTDAERSYNPQRLSAGLTYRL